MKTVKAYIEDMVKYCQYDQSFEVREITYSDLCTLKRLCERELAKLEDSE